MHKIISILTLIAFLLCSSMPALASNDELRKKIQHAREDHVVLEVMTSHDVKHLGYVIDTTDDMFALLNPVTGQKEEVNWGNVKGVKQIKALGRESKPRIDRWTGKERAITIELVDGSKRTGRIMETGDDSFLLREPKTGMEGEILYEQVKKVDDEPAGQKAIRRVMIGVGIGLLATWVVAGALLAGD